MINQRILGTLSWTPGGTMPSRPKTRKPTASQGHQPGPQGPARSSESSSNAEMLPMLPPTAFSNLDQVSISPEGENVSSTASTRLYYSNMAGKSPISGGLNGEKSINVIFIFPRHVWLPKGPLKIWKKGQGRGRGIFFSNISMPCMKR